MTSIPRSDSFAIPATSARAQEPGRDRSHALQELAAFHLLYGRAENAERFLRVALWIDPKDGNTQRLLAHAIARRGNAVEAAKMMMMAAKSFNAGLRLGDWKEVGLALLKQGQNELGLKFLTKKEGRSPQS